MRRGSGECKFPLCTKPEFCRGWCGMHYNRWRLHGDILPAERRKRVTGPGTECSVEGCPVQVQSRGLCGMHYTRWKHHRDPSVVLPCGKKPLGRRCSLDDCGRPHWAHGYCTMHYQRWVRWGDPGYTIYTHNPERASEIARNANRARAVTRP